MKIISHHRNVQLAERKFLELSKLYPKVELLSRRNAKGWYSKNGHTFVWKVLRPTAEFVIHFDYGSLKTKKKGDNRIRFQVHVIGPAGATIDDAIDAIRARNAGERWPKGWRKRAIFWGRGKALNSEACVWRTDPLPKDLRASAIGAGSSKDASHCRLSNRPTGGKRE